MAEEPNRMDGITDEPGGGADPQGGALESLRRGISAIQSVHEATRQHADARNASKQLSDQIAADTKTLEHREQIDRDFASIVSEQEAERAKASAALAGARSTAQQLEETIASLNDQLARMKQDHEESLRPYRELMESAKGRSDDAARSLSEAREIHTTPQVTAALRDAIAANRRQLDVLAAEIDRLAGREQALRDQTRRQRYVGFGIAAAAIILILLVVWLLTLIL